jgi:hypothetical protein
VGLGVEEPDEDRHPAKEEVAEEGAGAPGASRGRDDQIRHGTPGRCARLRARICRPSSGRGAGPHLGRHHADAHQGRQGPVDGSAQGDEDGEGTTCPVDRSPPQRSHPVADEDRGAKDHELVFPNFAGEHWSESDRHSWSGRHLKPALKEAGLPREVRMYDLRHSYVSMLIASGLNPVEVSRRAGHSATMTLDVYAHVYEEWEGRRIVIEDEIRKVRNLDVAATPAITSSE